LRPAGSLYKLTVSTRMRPGADALLMSLFDRLGLAPENWVERRRGKRVGFSRYFANRRQSDRVVRRLKALSLTGISVSLRHLMPSDWINPGQASRRPVRLTPSLVVVFSAASTARLAQVRTPASIRMDLGLAFGTGRHATTQLMAALIERCRGRFASFLDIGTGTGILSIVAARCGAQDIYALDYDRESILAARRHFRINGLKSVHLLRADFHHWPIRRQFDLVAANLLSHDLIQSRDKIIRRVRPHQYLAISGIARENLSQVRQAYRVEALRCLRFCQKKGWAALLFKKRG